MTSYRYDIRERVAAGAAALDRAMPDWRARVNRQTLNIRWAPQCLLGQLSYVEGEYPPGGYTEASQLVLGVDADDAAEANHGFDIHRGESVDVADELTAAWLELLS